MESTDPFIAVKEEVEQSVGNAKALYKRWQDLLEDGDVDEFEWTTNELRTSLKSIDWDLEDLEETISIVEESPARFKIGSGEIAERKRFIGRMKAFVQEVREATNSSKAKAKVSGGNKSKLMKGKSGRSRYQKLEQHMSDQNDAFLDDQEQQQQLTMRTQDTQLDEVGQTIGVLKQMGNMIGDELDDQNELLEDFDSDLTSTSDKLKHTMRKLDRTLAITKDGKQSCCICLLIVVLIILIIVYVT